MMKLYVTIVLFILDLPVLWTYNSIFYVPHCILRNEVIPNTQYSIQNMQACVYAPIYLLEVLYGLYWSIHSKIILHKVHSPAFLQSPPLHICLIWRDTTTEQCVSGNCALQIRVMIIILNIQRFNIAVVLVATKGTIWAQRRNTSPAKLFLNVFLCTQHLQVLQSGPLQTNMGHVGTVPHLKGVARKTNSSVALLSDCLLLMWKLDD